MRRRRSCNVGRRVAYTCCLRQLHRKKSIEVRSGEREGHSWNSLLLVPRIPPPGTASLMMFCEQAHCHVGNIRSGAETISGSQTENVHFKRSVFSIRDLKVSSCINR
ncbi:hypothetical protein AVEN_188212-1 [Araneus ventricosus]|uniref:Uncharacterized protein n=1 Tax=Araneus ventricosus TaxID=182803 RepID=A0A4Y2HY52_ARAVE|nr:hypothetical protein AVEN_188212-1 [Araneus ventricosus]